MAGMKIFARLLLSVIGLGSRSIWLLVDAKSCAGILD